MKEKPLPVCLVTACCLIGSLVLLTALALALLY